jgi:hypothetical protein
MTTKPYQACYECGAVYATAADLLAAHNKLMAEIGCPHWTEVSEVVSCPACTHDFLYPPTPGLASESRAPGRGCGGMSIYFDFRDWWIGYYRGDNHHYVCPLPTVVIRWRRRPPADQAWFWTPEWQAGEREASAAIADGDTAVYFSSEEFLAAMDALLADLNGEGDGQ